MASSLDDGNDMTPTIEKCKPGLPTAEICGMDLPIIAELGAGCFLVAHPNGAAIGTKTALVALSYDSRNFLLNTPEAIRSQAIAEFEAFVWPLVRGQFYEKVNS